MIDSGGDAVEGRKPSVAPTRPYAATLVGLVLAVGAGLAMPQLGDLGFDRSVAAFAMLALAAAIWIGAFLLAIRYAAGVWIAGSFVLFMLASIGAFRVGAAAQDRAVQDDLAATLRILVTADGGPVPSSATAAGPVSAAALRMAHAAAEAVAKRDGRMGAIGLEEITEPEAVARRPELLTDCGRFSRARPLLVRAADQILSARRTMADELRVAAETNQGARAALPQVLGSNLRLEGTIRSLTAAEQERLTQAERLCTFLARSRWQYADGGLRFADGAAAGEYYSIFGALDAATADREPLLERAEAARRRGQSVLDGQAR